MRRFARIAFSALVATVVALTGFEATSHRHAPKADGWHQSGPQGDAAHDEDLNSCSMCRLAHESSPAPTAAASLSVPLPRVATTPEISSPLAPPASAREHSPRAPPCLASC